MGLGRPGQVHGPSTRCEHRRRRAATNNHLSASSSHLPQTGEVVAIKKIQVGEKGEGVNVTALREVGAASIRSWMSGLVGADR